MELIELLRVIRRWLWLIAAIVVVTQVGLWLGMRSAEPEYTATVSLQISTPQREEVAAYDEYRSISLRDEITVAINNLIGLLEGEEVYNRTTSELGLTGEDAHYTITATRASDADFVTVIVKAGTPTLAAEIANKHVAIAIAYYGELRAQSTKAEKGLFAEQLRIAENEFRASEKELVDFRTQNGIYSLESQLSTQQKLLEQLQLDRDQRLLEQATAVNPTPVFTNKDGVIRSIDPVAEVDKLIAQRLQELDQLSALVPQYNVLTKNVEQARAAYQHILGKYSEATLKVTAVQAANFIQVIQPAYGATKSESSWLKLAILALAGSLGLGVMLAFILEYINSFKPATLGGLTHDPESPAGSDQEGEARSKDSIFQKLRRPSFWPNLELMKRVRALFRRDGSAYEPDGAGIPPDLAADKDPDAAQSKPASVETNPA